jgi:2-methylcitrate dehydratase PrpD
VLLKQRNDHGLDPANVRAVEVAVPALVARLVDRPATTGMAPNYARLCLPYVAACALLDGEVRVSHFDAASVGNERRLKYAERIRVRHDSAKDPNSLSPQTITLRLTRGDDLAIETGALPGHPDQPLSREQWTGKFRNCCRTARAPFDEQQMDELLFAFEHLAEVRDLRAVARMLAGRGSSI